MIVETASELLKLLVAKNNFHLRGKTGGRDDPLYAELRIRLGCNESSLGLGKCLEKTGASAVEFLNAFFRTIEPLSSMYMDIYRALKTARVTGAGEVARIAFGESDSIKDLDLEQFAKWISYFVQVFEDLHVVSWDDNSIGCFSDVMRALVGNYIQYPEAIDLAELDPLPESPTDRMLAQLLKEGHQVIESLVARTRATNYTPTPQLLLGLSVSGLNQVSRLLREPNPKWHDRDTAIRLLENLPYTRIVTRARVESPVERFRRVLDLPIWEHRWYLYEVWIAFQILRVINNYEPRVMVDAQGRLSLVRSQATSFASFSDGLGNLYSIEAQRETPISHAKRRGICPDYRIVRSGKTLVIVECKQRLFYVGASLETNMELYERGSPDSLVNIFVNYDKATGAKKVPARTSLIEEMRPGMTSAVQSFDSTIRKGLKDAGVVGEAWVVLLDVSGSMAGLYKAENHATFRAWCSDRCIRAMYSFSDDLHAPLSPDHVATEWSGLSCQGGTDVRTAITKARSQHGERVRLLVVTDQVPGQSLATPNVFLWAPSTKPPRTSDACA
ncbi:MAG: hypothetical protein IT384_24765 [Deltaproteobacteria bacterium]|nr:hypothetical protein [Deltaproteobacteria bacterium]